MGDLAVRHRWQNVPLADPAGRGARRNQKQPDVFGG